MMKHEKYFWQVTFLGLILVEVFQLGTRAVSDTDLAPLGGDASEAWRINITGQGLGDSFASGGSGEQTFRYDGVDDTTDSGALREETRDAWGITTGGQTIGDGSTSDDGDERAPLRENTNSATDLGALGVETSEAWGINTSEQPLGESLTSGAGSERLFLGDGTTDLSALGGEAGEAAGFIVPIFVVAGIVFLALGGILVHTGPKRKN
jgi:hypothetical protein